MVVRTLLPLLGSVVNTETLGMGDSASASWNLPPRPHNSLLEHSTIEQQGPRLEATQPEFASQLLH